MSRCNQGAQHLQWLLKLIGIAGTQHYWCLISRRGICDLSWAYCLQMETVTKTHPWKELTFSALMYMCTNGLLSTRWCLNPSHIPEKLASQHTCCVLMRALLKQLQLNSCHTRGEPCFVCLQALLTAGWGLWVEEHWPMEKHAICNCLQDVINVRKTVHKALPDLAQRTKVWSSLVQGLTPFHIHSPQRCCQVKSMSQGYLQYPFSAVFIHHCHCFSAKHPEGHGERFCPHFICTHFTETEF